MFKATREIYEMLQQEEELRVFAEDHEETSEVWMQFSVKNGGKYCLRFISADDDNDVMVGIFGLMRIAEEKMPAMLELINHLNGSYRFVKFDIDEDNDLNLTYDFPLDCISPAACAKEMVIRFVQTLNEVYPQLMNTLWNGKN